MASGRERDSLDDGRPTVREAAGVHMELSAISFASSSARNAPVSRNDSLGSQTAGRLLPMAHAENARVPLGDLGDREATNHVDTSVAT